jgi:protein-S-isoprenylcysteine O-methyltransferase Ste14
MEFCGRRATTEIREGEMLNLPPPIWTLIYLLVAAAISYIAGWPGAPGLWLIGLGAALILGGLAVAIAAARLFRREGTEINPTSPSNRKLVTEGPFRFTRNPMYLGLTAISLGVAFCVGSWPMLLAPIAIFATANSVHIPFEEEKMRRQFGDAYDSYRRRVRRWL